MPVMKIHITGEFRLARFDRNSIFTQSELQRAAIVTCVQVGLQKLHVTHAFTGSGFYGGNGNYQSGDS